MLLLISLELTLDYSLENVALIHSTYQLYAQIYYIHMIIHNLKIFLEKKKKGFKYSLEKTLYVKCTYSPYVKVAHPFVNIEADVTKNNFENNFDIYNNI